MSCFLLQAPEIIEQCPQLSKIRSTEQNGEVVKPPDKPTKNHNIRDTEVNALNMAIDTLRWQLTQVPTKLKKYLLPKIFKLAFLLVHQSVIQLLRYVVFNAMRNLAYS